MIRRTMVAIAAGLCAGVSVAHAQITRPRVQSTQPDYWVGLSLGYVDGMTLSDNATGALWRFGYSSQIRATIEKSLQGGSTLGLAAGFSTASLTYEPGSSFTTVCPGSCEAQADITQWLAFFRGGTGGYGFRAFYQIEGGVTQFGNFRERTTQTKLPPNSASNDLTFGFGGGFSYGLSTIADIYAGEMLDFVLHQQATDVNQSAPRMLTFRAGFRFGF